MRLFVTGGTGFIGSYFLRAAVESGHSVIALRRLSGIPPGKVPQAVHWVEGALDGPHHGLENCEALVHFAAAGVSPQRATLEEMFEINVAASLRLWHQANRCGVSRLIICGSCFEYGSAADAYDFVPSNAPLRPVTGYGASKAAATMAALGLASMLSLRVSILRPFTVYGEGQHPSNFWPSLKAAAQSGADFSMTAGEQVRDFTPVEEVAARFLAELERPLLSADCFIDNIGTGRPRTLLEFARTWWREWEAKGVLLPGTLPYRPNEVMRYVPECRALSDRSVSR